MRLFTGLLLGLLLGCVGCSDSWSATIECELCTGKEEITGLSCASALGAQAAAEAECARRNGKFVKLISEDTEVILTTNCPADRHALPPVLSDLVKWAQTIAAAEPPSCPAPKIAFTVVFHNEWQSGMYCEGVPRLVRVGYYKYSPTPPNEYAEVEGSVDFGASHTIAIPDAKPSFNKPDEAGLVKVEFQVLTLDDDTMCFGIPLDDESYGPVISEGIREGSTVHVTLNNQGNVQISISAANTAVAKGNLHKTLQPIPDPMFAVKNR